MEGCSSDWQMKVTTLAEKGQYLLDNANWSDCSFSVGSTKEIFKAHKIFLAMSSPVFEQMFFGPLAEQEFPINIPDIEETAFKLLLQYIYTGNVKLESSIIASLVFKAANKYMIPDLEKLCADTVWNLLSPETACLAYELAKFYGYKDLESHCLKIISLNTTKVLNDPSFQLIGTSTMETILDMDNLTISSEMELFDALIRWAKHKNKVVKGATLRDIVKTTLPKVRFLTPELKEIIQGAESCELLTLEEKYAILMNVINPNCNVPMPPDFSKSKEQRGGNIKIPEEDNWKAYIHNVNVKHKYRKNCFITSIHFQVFMKRKILGVQMNHGYKYKTRNKNSEYRQFHYVKRLCIVLYTEHGTQLCVSHFGELNKTSKYKIDGGHYLERNNGYVLILYQYTDYVDSTQKPEAHEESDFRNAIYYHFKNLPIESIILA